MPLRSGRFLTSMSPFGTGRLNLDDIYSISPIDESTNPPTPGTPPPREGPGGAGPSPNPKIPKVGKTPAKKQPKATPKAVRRPAPQPKPPVRQPKPKVKQPKPKVPAVVVGAIVGGKAKAPAKKPIPKPPIGGGGAQRHR